MGHILTRSGVAAKLNVDALPLSAELLAAVGREQALAWALSGGDDYELCFCAPVAQRSAVAALSDTLNIPLQRIGVIESGVSGSLALVDSDGKEQPYVPRGYQHFD